VREKLLHFQIERGGERERKINGKVYGNTLLRKRAFTNISSFFKMKYQKYPYCSSRKRNSQRNTQQQCPLSEQNTKST
jgi:hypothetical protein